VSDTEAAARAGAAAGHTPAAPGKGTRERARDWLVLVLPAAVTLIVGGYRLGSASMWRDEAYTKEVVTRSPGQIIALLGHQDAVHGAYYMLMHEVTGLTGTSAAGLRLPSLIAMVITASFTAAAGRRLALLAGGPAPAATGLLAGLVFATAPAMTWYAQDAREYATVTMLATIATYLFVRAVPDGRWGWWAGYGAAVALTGFFNLFAVLIVVAHALSLLIAGLRVRAGRGTPAAAPAGSGVPAAAAALDEPGAAGPPGTRIGALPAGRLAARWLAAVVAAGIVLTPMAWASYGQRGQISWLTAPSYGTIVKLVTSFAGSRTLVFPFAVLAIGGAVAGLAAHRGRPLSPGVVALPWLVAPPVILIAVSYLHPVYDARYIEFCLPALAILVAAGLAWLGRLAALTPLSRARLAWLPPAVAAVALAVALIAPQQSIRLSSARPDNLRKISAILAASEKPGDAVLYIPMQAHALSEAYPAPFRRLRDLALARSPRASATLNGILVSPAVLRKRFTGVRRVWIVAEESGGHIPAPSDALERTEMSLVSGMNLVRQWRANEDILALYAAPSR
jgi:mannosyltransferase